MVGGRIGGLDEELLGADICVIEKEFAPCVSAIPAGTPDLLIVGLKGAGNVPVDDKPNIRTIDTHAKGVGSDDDRRLTPHKGILHTRALLVFHRAVVRQRPDAMHGEHLLHAFNHLASGAINNAGPEELDDLEQALQLLAVSTHTRDIESKIGALKASDNNFRLRATPFTQTQMFDDIFPHRVGRGRGDGKQADGRRKRRNNLAQMQVVRTEIMPPSGDTVGLVNGQHGKRRFTQRL